MESRLIQISVIIPLLNEEESLPELCEWIESVMKKNHYTYEVLMIDDGSTDRSWEVIQQLSRKNPAIKGYRFNRNYGKSAALQTGFQKCCGEVVITMDADLQDSPDEIPELYNMIMSGRYDLVSGWKKKRYDPLSKTIPTKLFNWATRIMSGIKLHDFNCGLKAYHHRVVKNIEVYGEMHRYIPFIAKWYGFKKIGEKVVQHRPRKYGTSKFGLERFINGFLDLLSITFVHKFKKKPMHFFGTLGTLSFLLGFSLVTWLIVEKVYNIYWAKTPIHRDITEHTFFYIALTATVIGVQLFLAGFLGEMMVIYSDKKNDYIISDTTPSAQS
ncbi:MAG: glycosyltransferase family 2 protein [Cytophagaceae bacterium]|nr:glycosyltransferase family 2 protein [Cytophagaceae bacterium]MDW8456765.1 glycosyltransferase family 2 protein [Cytophagaceae bacterium]